MFMIRIQDLEWVQGKIQDVIPSATCQAAIGL
jgi:hypothetical protein